MLKFIPVFQILFFLLIENCCKNFGVPKVCMSFCKYDAEQDRSGVAGICGKYMSTIMLCLNERKDYIIEYLTIYINIIC